MTGVQTCALPICFPVTIITHVGVPLIGGGARIVIIDEAGKIKGLMELVDNMLPSLCGEDGITRVGDFVGKEVELVGGEFLVYWFCV